MDHNVYFVMLDVTHSMLNKPETTMYTEGKYA